MDPELCDRRQESKCLVSGTTPAEKTTLVRWMFAMMALHPEVESGSKVTAGQRTALSKETAQLFQRLLTDACADETREAVKYEGAATIESSFSLLGQVAARELFSHPRVAEGLSQFAGYVDSDAFKGVLDATEERTIDTSQANPGLLELTAPHVTRLQ